MLAGDLQDNQPSRAEANLEADANDLEAAMCDEQWRVDDDDVHSILFLPLWEGGGDVCCQGRGNHVNWCCDWGARRIEGGVVLSSPVLARPGPAGLALRASPTWAWQGSHGLRVDEWKEEEELVLSKWSLANERTWCGSLGG